MAGTVPEQHAYTFICHLTVSVCDRWNTQFRFDVSDATGIALFGVLQRAHPLEFASGFRVASFGLPNARVGSQRQPESVQPSSPQIVSVSPPVAPSCTLCTGCVLSAWHSGPCEVRLQSPLRHNKGKRTLSDDADCSKRSR